MPREKETPLSAELETTADNGASGAVEGNAIDTEHCMSRVRSFHEWCLANQRLIEAVEDYVLNEVSHGRKFAVKAIIEWIRWHDYANDAGQPVKVSNDYAPMLARMLIRKYPQVREYIEIHPSMYDRVLI